MAAAVVVSAAGLIDMAQPRSEWDKQMQHLDAEIRRLEAEYNMFFAGRLPRPPFETKNRVHALVKKHDNSFIRNTADRFRFETLQTRYYKFMELVDKQMTARELGRPMIGRPGAAPPKAPAQPPPAEAAQSAHGAGAPASAADRAREAAEKAAEKVVKFGRADAVADSRVKELYEQLAAAKKQVGEAPVAYERVAALVKAQVTKFADEGTNVAFKIALKDGKVSLTVKPEKGEG
jgi:hypothetical protein